MKSMLNTNLESINTSWLLYF